MNLWMRLPCHPNIVPFDRIVIDELEGRVVGFTSGYVPGGNLEENKSRVFRLKWLQQLIKVVDDLNLEYGIAHQDIAPRNLLVDEPTDSVRLFDFNFAARINYPSPGKGENYLEDRNDIKGVIFTTYEIITQDNSLRSMPHEDQSLDNLGLKPKPPQKTISLKNAYGQPFCFTVDKCKSMDVILVDCNAEALASAKKQINGIVHTSIVDVANIFDWSRLKKEEYVVKTLEKNVFGVIHGIGAFLPVVRKASEAKPTVNVITGSEQGITNPPGNAAYNATKATVKSLAEQLSLDLGDTKTSAHLLDAGRTHTGLTGAASGKEKPAGAWTPEQVADYLYRKMPKVQFYIICPDNDVDEQTDKKRIAVRSG
ncbi:uncharacterized protein J7T54_007653 [Emericellopsis cladophorae]|uniref:Protein kinase domain-containing protein n=1 Tax=Emericellopsis cladophorae TaxID=2686198 RepID=A0A9P9XUN5_9HYPO|nr:uncharacterized protein J7T54_007653 [Emericellopsis cladophorae]KAI6778045.1 hypothetical protein J7T54_007653 [Emericellopsis cladophorae]